MVIKDLRYENAPTPTYKIAKCIVCRSTWVVVAGDREIERGCTFCGACKAAIVIKNEK
jgi:hypothetical protein